MTQYAIVTDCNRCIGCLGCSVACKAINGVPTGNFWNKTLRVGPNPTEGGSGNFPDVEMYFMTVSCQHCENPECVKVCPTGASYKDSDGTVQIDKEKCIGCQFCAMACPYGVRYLNEEQHVVEKCTLCQQRLKEGELPQCVSQCGGIARFFGDLDEGIETFKGACDKTLGDYLEDFDESDVHTLKDVGNKPSGRYSLRRMKWRAGEGE